MRSSAGLVWTRWRRIVCLLGAVAVSGVIAAPAHALSLEDWPQRLFVLQPNHDAQDPVADVAEAPDGRVVFAEKSGVLREITPAGRLRTLATLGAGIAGVAADTDGSVLVVENTRIIRVSPTGQRTVIAGIGQAGYSGDGGLARLAQIHPAEVHPPAFGDGDFSGLTRVRDGSIVFTDQQNNRLRRIRRDGIIETIAGNGSPAACSRSAVTEGEPAAATRLSSPADVIEARDGSLIVADRWTCRLRRIREDGTITTIAGTGRLAAPGPSDAGRPAIALPVYLPRGLAELPNGDIVFSDGYQVDRIAHDGTWHPYVARSTTDFAGRGTDAVESGVTGIAVTREGGVLIAWGSLYYLAPTHTSRTLVRVRSARVRSRSVSLDVVGTQPGRATLEVPALHGVASSARTIRAGRGRVTAHGRFRAEPVHVRVTLRGPDGATARDDLWLHTGTTLSMPLALALGQLGEDENPLAGCRRMTVRRIDCAYRNERIVTAWALRSDGTVAFNGYTRRSTGSPYRLHPAWLSPHWSVMPLDSPYLR